MSSQQHLFKPPIADGNLTSKQARIMELLQAATSGMRAIDIGRVLHLDSNCPVCTWTRTCQYAARDANQVLDSMGTRTRGLVIRRQSGLWELTPAARPHDTGTFPSDF